MKTSDVSEDTLSRKAGECVAQVIRMRNLRRATAYISPALVVKATAQRRYRSNAKQVTALVTAGAPNFAERRFIKVCQKAGVAFPLKEIQFKWWKNPG